jgi:hypothetical protein
MTNAQSNHPLVATVRDRFGGLLASGAHRPDDDSACLLEAASVARGVEWTDGNASGLPDIRPLNDSSFWRDDQHRTEAMLAIGVAWWGWPDWSEAKRRRVVRRLVIRTVRDVLPLALTAYPEEADRCRRVRTLSQARRAAAAFSAAAADAAYHAASAAHYAAAAEAAEASAAAAFYVDVAFYAAADALDVATRVWTEAARA